MFDQLQTQNTQVTPLKETLIDTFGQIQPHGIIFVLKEPELSILQVSSNVYTNFGKTPQELLQGTLEALIDDFQLEQIKVGLQAENLDYINPIKMWVRSKGDDYVVFDAIFHRNSEGFLILELEPTITQENIAFLSFYHLARASISQTASLHDFSQIIVQEVRKITGFDRVMLYKFDSDGHGSVIGEEKIDGLEPYLGLHYPESDIPKPARKLLTSNWIRLIANTHAESVEIIPIENPISQLPANLTHSILRSALPCHIEYLRNMGVGASLTISLMKEGILWGLIACHHQTPKHLSYELRKACEFLGKVIFSEVSAKEETEDYEYRMQLNHVQSRLIEQMSQAENFIDGLVKYEPNLLDLTNAQGAAVCFDGNYTLIGETPTESDLNLLVQWLKNNVREEVFYTDSLPSLFPDAENYKNVASGLLAIPISKRNYVLWFRQEVIQTVNWGGNPNNAFELSQSRENHSLHPRKSFELWKQTVKLTSLPWQFVEIKAALELRKGIVNIVLRQSDELAQLVDDLARSNAELKKFAYVASHDLQAPLNQVANYVQLLEMRYGNQLDKDASEFINYAVEGVTLMQTLIDDVLAYSKVDLQATQFELTDVNTLLESCLTTLHPRITETKAIVTHDHLPTIMADSIKLMQLFKNLIGNAIKFGTRNPPKIHIGTTRLEDEWLFSVHDNGIGIDPKYSDRIFIIFQRLHTRDEYPGTGVGLAICKKIIECHRGRIWVESKLGEGSTFYFTLPVGEQERDLTNNRYKTQSNSFS